MIYLKADVKKKIYIYLEEKTKINKFVLLFLAAAVVHTYDIILSVYCRDTDSDTGKLKCTKAWVTRHEFKGLILKMSKIKPLKLREKLRKSYL